MAEQRRQVLELIVQACEAGARKQVACRALGVSLRTVQRWEAEGLEDQRFFNAN